MTPDQQITFTHIVIFGVLALVFFGIPGLLIARQDYEQRQRKKRYAQAKAEDEARWQLYLRHQIEVTQRQQAAIAQQRQDQPAVTVPVTDCDRRDRRRILPLERS